MKAESVSFDGYRTFLYRDVLPGVVLDGQYSLLFNFRSGTIIQVRNVMLPSDELYEALKNLKALEFSKERPSKDDRLARLCLILTSSCNMRCVYCYNDAGQFTTRMPFTIARVAIDHILKRKDIDYFLLQFYGGEPTLNPDCLHKAISYAKETSHVPVVPFIVTNGTMKRDTLDFLIQKKTRFVFSCDLIRSIHDRQRPLSNSKSCFELVIENIRQAAHAQRTVSIRSVITNVNVHHLVEMIQIAASLGAKEVILGPCEINVGRARFREDITRPPLEDYVHNYILAMREAERLGILLVDHIYRILHAKDAHQSEILFVLPDGNVTQNTTVLDRQAENADRYITGAFALSSGELIYDQHKREHLQQILNQNTDHFCRLQEACALLPICQGRYKAYEFTVEDHPRDLDTYNCEYRKQILADYIIHLRQRRQPHTIKLSSSQEELLLFPA